MNLKVLDDRLGPILADHSPGLRDSAETSKLILEAVREVIIDDLIQRMRRAEGNLRRELDQPITMNNSRESSRIYGKRQGVSLARSYVEEVLR